MHRKGNLLNSHKKPALQFAFGRHKYSFFQNALFNLKPVIIAAFALDVIGIVNDITRIFRLHCSSHHIGQL